MMRLIRKHVSFLLALALCLSVCLLFCTRKKGMFIDEIYTYGLSNSAYAPYLSDLRDGELIDQVFTQEDIQEYLTVGENDAFSFGSVYYNQTQDVHPPLYYMLIHLVSSLFRGSSSMWIGLGVNVVLYLLTLAALYFLALRLYGSEELGAIAVLLYGLSVIGTSTVMMIRMYMLLTLFTVLLALAVLRVLREGGRKSSYLLLTLTMFCGMMTQYYFVFYAFFLCAIAFFFLAAQKQWRRVGAFSLAALLGVGLMFLVFPAAVRHLFVGNGQVVGGSSVLESLRDTAKFREHIDDFRMAEDKMKAIRQVFWGSVCLLLPALWVLHRRKEKPSVSPQALILLLPAPLAFLAVAIVSPVQELRYIYNLIPIFVLGVCFVLMPAVQALGEGWLAFWGKKGAVLLVAALAVLSAKAMPPSTLFPTMTEYDEAIEAHCEDKCVYYSDGYFSSVTQDLLQLRLFPEFLVANSTLSETLSDYIAEEEEIVLYIDTDEDWSSGYDAEKVLRSFAKNLGFTHAELLYRYSFEGNGGLSECYVLTRQ